jgi:hypothetical protein
MRPSVIGGSFDDQAAYPLRQRRPHRPRGPNARFVSLARGSLLHQVRRELDDEALTGIGGIDAAGVV